MSDTITAEQVRKLWETADPGAIIDRGEDLAPVTLDDLAALADQVDTDEQGRPLDDQWEVLADQLNADAESEPATGPAAEVLQAVEDARRARDNAERELNEVIRSAMLNRKVTKVKVKDLEKAADLTRSRLYQIRDGRR